jgi:hypothetical protein
MENPMNTSDLCNRLKLTASKLRQVAQLTTVPDNRFRVVAVTRKPEEAIDRALRIQERMGTPEAKAKVQEFLTHLDPEIVNARKDLCSNRWYDSEAQAKAAIQQFLNAFNPWLDAIGMEILEADFKIVPAASLV